MNADKAWVGYASAIGATAGCTLIGLAMTPRFALVNVAMIYLLGVVIVARRFDRGPSILASVLAVAALDFLFVPPTGAFTVDDSQYLVTFAIMLVTALVISGLAASVRRQAQAQAALSVEAESERIRGTLLASISHDLRTPLAVLVGAASGLAESGERMTPQERKALEANVLVQAREMSDRVSKILQMTRLETGVLALERDWTSIEEVAASVVRRLAERMAAHRVLIDLAPDLPLVRVDAVLIEQAIANLLENAALHTPPGTVVRLRAVLREGRLVVSVEDFGPGLADEDIERVFSMFHHGRAEGAAGGVGLGLAICRAIVKLHGGEAWAEKIPGGGTAFRFSLPLEPAPSMPAEPLEA